MIVDCEIRRLEAADAKAFRSVRLEALQQHPESFAGAYEGESLYPLSWFEDRIVQTPIFGAFVHVDLVGVAGCRALEAKMGHKRILWGMFVRSSARRGGVGRRLVTSVVEFASRNAEQLQLTVVSDNEAAVNLYRSFDFVEYGREINALKFDDRYLDEILMVKYLRDPSR